MKNYIYRCVLFLMPYLSGIFVGWVNYCIDYNSLIWGGCGLGIVILNLFFNWLLDNWKNS